MHKTNFLPCLIFQMIDMPEITNQFIVFFLKGSLLTKVELGTKLFSSQGIRGAICIQTKRLISENLNDAKQLVGITFWSHGMIFHL